MAFMLRNAAWVIVLFVLAPSISAQTWAGDAIKNGKTETSPSSPANTGSELDGAVGGRTLEAGNSQDYVVDVESYRIEPLELGVRPVITLDEALLICGSESYRARIARYGFDKQVFNISIALAEFKPVLSLSSGIRSVERGGASTLAASSFISSTKSTFLTFDVSERFPSGQTFSFSQNLSRQEVSVAGAQAQAIPKSYSGEVGLVFSQPLGRGRGIEATTTAIRQAEESLGLEEFRVDYTERQLRHDTYLLYYQLVSQRKALSVREANFDAGLKLLERNYERYKVGLAIRADVLQAENNVLNQKLRLIDARRAYLDGLDQLALLLGLAGPIGIDEGVELKAEPVGLDRDRDWLLARGNSMDLKEVETQLRLKEIEKVFRKSELRPDLTLSFGLTRQGEDKTASGALRNLDNQSYSLVLNYRLPWGKVANKARLSQTEIELESLKTQREELVQSLRQEWDGLFRELVSKKSQLELAESNVSVARENYNIQVERNLVGLANTIDVIQAQEDLLEAELSLVTAQVDYQTTRLRLLLMAGII